MPSINLSAEDKNDLLVIARQSIQYGLTHSSPMKVDVQSYNRTLQTQCATFVTLNLEHQLRGCIGTLEAYQSLVKDVADHAFAAAFNDPRFKPVSSIEEPQLDIHISILTPAETMHCNSEEDLLQQLQKGIDGLILKSGHHQATFLPAVWETLPDSRQFVQHLKIKAGLDKNFWSKDIQLQRYHTLSIPD